MQKFTQWFYVFVVFILFPMTLCTFGEVQSITCICSLTSHTLNPRMSTSTDRSHSCIQPLPHPHSYLCSLFVLTLTPAFISSAPKTLPSHPPLLSNTKQIGVTSRQGSNGSEPEPSGSAVSPCERVECVQ